MSEYKTVNRGMLKRAAMRGELYVRCEGSYTDDYAWDAAVNFSKMNDFKKVFFMPEGLTAEAWRETRYAAQAREEIIMDAGDFDTKSGRAYSVDGVTRLYIHSNLSYTAQIRKA